MATPEQQPVFPHAPPPDKYGVRNPLDGIYYGWAGTPDETVAIACAIALRSMIDLEVIDPSGNRYAYVGQFETPVTAALQLVASVDPDEPLSVNVTVSRPETQVDWGDGSSSMLQETSGRHTYATAGTYNLIATLGSESADAWVALETPPTIPPQEGP